MSRTELLGWTAVGLVLAALAVPWFLWGNDAVIAGLPAWLWWHVCWMILSAAVFRLFADRAWGIGIQPGGSLGSTPTGEADESAATGDRR